MLRVVYPGTFDPLTRGHEDLIRRAGNLFDEVVVAIAESKNKSPFFSLKERVDMATQVLQPFSNVRVLGFTGLLMHFVREQQSHVILRGLRAVSDFEYEFQLAGMNRGLYPEVETLFLTPAEEFLFISASMVKEIAVLGGEVSHFVHPLIKRGLDAKIKV